MMPPRSNRPRSVISNAATTLSSAARSAIPTPSRNSPSKIRRSPSSTCRARSTAPISGRSTVAAMRVSICGMVAGAMSKSGHLGFVTAHPIGLVNWTVNAFALGAQSVNPKAEVHAVFTGAWDDPVKERAADTAVIDQGADVLGQQIDTPTTQIVAQERGVYGTGHNRDLSEFAPKATLCSSIWVWDRFLVPELKKIIAGDWTPDPYGAFPGIAGGGTDIACCNSGVPKDVVDKVMAVREEIIKGTKQVFGGPLSDRDGKERVAAGKVLDDGGLWKMDWCVKGVITQ